MAAHDPQQQPASLRHSAQNDALYGPGGEPAAPADSVPPTELEWTRSVRSLHGYAPSAGQ
jgi:hypothetical protein